MFFIGIGLLACDYTKSSSRALFFLIGYYFFIHSTIIFETLGRLFEKEKNVPFFFFPV